MKVQVSNEGTYTRKIHVTIPADDVRKELDDAYRVYSQRIRLPGFRQGKVPRRVLEGKFGSQVRAEVANNLVQSGWTHAMDTEGLEPVGQPNVTEAGEVQKNADFAFEISVDVKPEIALETYKGVDVYFPPVEITDAELDAGVDSRLEAAARLVEVTDRGAKSGDMVMVELVAKDGDEELAREVGTMIRTEADPYYPGVETHLEGMKATDNKTAEITFGDDARTEAIAGKTCQVELTVISVQANEVPKLTNDVAEELGFEGGKKGMRAAVKAQLEDGRRDLARNQARANLLEQLIALNTFDVPPGMIGTSLNMLVEELKMQQAWRTGRDPKEIQFDAATMADLQTRAAFAAKSSLILEFVTRTESISVSEDDLEAKFQELAEMRNQTVEAIKGWFAADGAVDELNDRILEEKTLDWLLERANLVDTPPAPPASEEPGNKEAKAIIEAKAETKAKAKKKTKKAEAPAASGDVDTAILKLSIGKLKDALATGEHDANIDGLIAAEEAGKARKGALDALNARK